MSDNGNGIPRLLTVEEVSDLFQLPRSWVYERTRRRGIERLPHLKLGKYLRFEETAVQEYLDRQRIGAQPNA
jgi:excisionase family DNA binding protein